jgi:hypothetical protein
MGGEGAEPDARTDMPEPQPWLLERDGAAVGRAFASMPLSEPVSGQVTPRADGGDRLQHRGPRTPGGRPRRRQSSERDPFGLELGHGGVWRFWPSPIPCAFQSQPRCLVNPPAQALPSWNRWSVEEVGHQTR